MCKYFSFIILNLVSFSLLSQTSPKVVETPINIIKLDSSKMPNKSELQTIFQCFKNNKVVYVDSVSEGLTNCSQINQTELTKFQPKPSDNTPSLQPEIKNTRNTSTQNNVIRPNRTPSIVNVGKPNTKSSYRPPCTGMITYKGNNYLLPNNRPCPFSDNILSQLTLIPN